MLLKLLERLDLGRFEPVVIALGRNGEIGIKIEALGIPVIVIDMPRNILFIKSFIKLVRALRGLRPNVIHTWLYHADFLGGLAGRLVGVKNLAWGLRHSDFSPSANKLLTLAIVKFCALLSNYIPRKILVNSVVARTAHEAIGYVAEKMVVIPNGFDLERFVPAPLARVEVRSELGLDKLTPLVGVIGRFHPQKNHLGFVQAMAELHALRPDVHFILAGQGVDSDNNLLVNAVQSAGVDCVCHLLGPRRDVSRLMAALDVLALPSVGEAFPNVVGEAMACAVPCAVTDVGDSAWIVGETGGVVSAGDMSGLAHAIRGLLDLPADERTAVGAAARDRVASLFEIGGVVKKYEAFYESLVADKV